MPRTTLQVSGLSLLSTFSLLAILLAGCSGTVESERPSSDDSESTDSGAGHVAETGDHAGAVATFDDPDELEERFSGDPITVDPDQSFRQVSLMFDGPRDPEMEWRTPGSEQWTDIEVTWSERTSHVGRILLEKPAREVHLRTQSKPSYLHLGFFETVEARTDGTLTRDLPRVDQAPSEFQHIQSSSTAQTGAVVTRSEWGARRPYKRCGRSHNPYRMTIHHTVVPANDGGNPARRLRQIQAYHIDNNGWCDIGYHFVVSQSGKIFEARRSEKRTGAHVLGHNTGNLGVALIGNFDTQSVGATQFAATSEIVHEIHDTYGIPLNNQHFKGHTEWPGQDTSCPGQNMLTRLEELARKSRSGSQGGTGSYDGEFGDDDGTHHEDAIDTLANRGVVDGCSAGSPPRFCPDRSVTRGEFAVMLDEAASLPAATRDYFSDDDSNYYEDAANRLAEAGILDGCGQTAYSRMCGSENLTRAEAAVLLDETFPLGSTSNDFFQDDEGHWAESAINNIAAARVANGCSSDAFCPDEPTTRGQAATLICKSKGWSC